MKFKRNKLKDFREIKFNPFSGGGLGSIDFSDVFGGLISSKKNLYLGRFTVDDLKVIMDRVGITAYLENGGTIENAQAMAAHESPRTTKLYDRTSDEIALDEIERISI